MMLQVSDLSVVYPDGTKALSSVSFGAEEGENIALVGANGAGKSTLLLSLVGIANFSGRVALDGLLLEKKTVEMFRRSIGMVFQDPNDQLFMPTVGGDIAYGLRGEGLSAAEIESRVSEAAERLGLSRLLDKSVLRLSGGEKRMAAIAGILVMRPRLILFDEPAAFLDPRAKRRLLEALKALPCAKLVATHDYGFAKALCPRTIILKEGRVVADGPSVKLLSDEKFLEEQGL